MAHRSWRGLAAASVLLLFPLVAGANSPLRVGITVVRHPGVRPAAGDRFGPVGNVWLVGRDGRRRMLSRTGRAFDVKASPDGRWVGWIEGQVIPYPDRDRPLTPNDGYPKVPTFFPAALVLLGHGAVRRIVPHQLYDVVWRFVPDRNAVAVGSAGSHGRLFLQLFDLRTGKLLASGTNNTVPLPPWSRGLIRDDTLVPGR